MSRASDDAATARRQAIAELSRAVDAGQVSPGSALERLAVHYEEELAALHCRLDRLEGQATISRYVDTSRDERLAELERAAGLRGTR